MSYRYTIGNDTEKEIKSIIQERFQRSVYEFSDPDNTVEHANHQMRKNMKKARAALRLVRDSIGEDDYKKWNKRARDIARLGAPLRESEVSIYTLESVHERYRWKVNNGFYQKVHSFLQTEHEKLKNEMLEKQNYIQRVSELLEELQGDISTLSFDEEGFIAFKKGMKRVYKRGRKASKKAGKQSTPENFHEWRKRVKYLWYHIRILKNIWPEGLKGYAKELHHVSDLLGDDHDVYDLKDKLHDEFGAPDFKLELTELDVLVREYSEEKRREALTIGEKLYAEKPKLFVKRIHMYWEAALSG